MKFGDLARQLINEQKYELNEENEVIPVAMVAAPNASTRYEENEVNEVMPTGAAGESEQTSKTPMLIPDEAQAATTEAAPGWGPNWERVIGKKWPNARGLNGFLIRLERRDVRFQLVGGHIVIHGEVSDAERATIAENEATIIEARDLANANRCRVCGRFAVRPDGGGGWECSWCYQERASA